MLIADELTPSLAAQVDWTKVRGFATDAGSRTYHTAILARSLEVPAVVGLHDASRRIAGRGSWSSSTATPSEVILDPDDEVLARAARHADDRRPAPAADAERRRPAATADGVRIRLDANIEFPDDLAAARYAGAEGIGLYRSEFLLTSGAATSASEDAQYEIYRGMLEGMAPGAVTVRTFDVDEDQLASRLGRRPLRGGWVAGRGARQPAGSARPAPQPDAAGAVSGAAARAAAGGAARAAAHHVSVRVGRRAAARGAADGRRGRGRSRSAGARRCRAVPIGVMIEIPAAAYTADLLAREVDFFTIGTNDLIQYCLAVDRADERVSRLYEPLHPAILRVIVMVRRAAARQRIPVSLCGEMASDPALLTLLVGLGLTEFSMTPGAIPVAKQVLSEVRSDDLRALARRVLRLPTVDEIERELLAALGRPSGRLGRA